MLVFLIKYYILIYSSGVSSLIFNLPFKLFISHILYFNMNTSSWFLRLFVLDFIFKILPLSGDNMLILNTCSVWSFILLCLVYNNQFVAFLLGCQKL